MAYQHPLRRIRKRFNLSQNDLAIMTDLSQPDVSEVETGKEEPNSNILTAIEQFGYDVDNFLREHEDFKKKKKLSLWESVLESAK